MTPVLAVEDLWKRYGEKAAVAGASFSVRPGTLFGLLGGNGAGKTTTIRIVLDIIKADGGRVAIFGGPLSEATKDRIGFMPEERGMYVRMKVIEYLLFIGMLRGMSSHAATREAVKWLERLELGDRQKSLINELSKGNQQKIQLIATLIHDPELLILDEPFSGLDPVNRHKFEEIILDKRREGRAVIFSTHVLEQAERLLDDVVMYRQGQIVVSGSIAEVKRHYGSGWVAIRGEGTAAALERHPAVSERRALEDGTVRYKLASDSDVPAVLRHLVESGARVDHFQRIEASLNDIFLERVGGIDRGLDEVQPWATADGGA